MIEMTKKFIKILPHLDLFKHLLKFSNDNYRTILLGSKKVKSDVIKNNISQHNTHHDRLEHQLQMQKPNLNIAP